MSTNSFTFHDAVFARAWLATSGGNSLVEMKAKKLVDQTSYGLSEPYMRAVKETVRQVLCRLRNHFFVVIPNPQGDDKVLEAARQDALAHLLHTVPGAYIPLPDKSLLEHILKTIPEPNTDELPLSTLQAFTLAMLFSHVATTDESIQQASDLADALGHELAVEELAFGRFTAIELARSFANSHFGRNALGTLTEFDDESRLSTYIVRGEGRRAATDTEVFDYLSDRAKMTEMPRNFMP